MVDKAWFVRWRLATTGGKRAGTRLIKVERRRQRRSSFIVEDLEEVGCWLPCGERRGVEVWGRGKQNPPGTAVFVLGIQHGTLAGDVERGAAKFEARGLESSRARGGCVATVDNFRVPAIVRLLFASTWRRAKLAPEGRVRCTRQVC